MIAIILISNIFASDSLAVYGRIIDTSSVGIADAKIITEDGVVAFSDKNGNYMINISKDYVPIDHQDIVVNTVSDYSVKIYNLLGQKIFDKKYQHSDFTQFNWNGLNKRGELVSSGIYFSILEVNKQVVARNKITVDGQEVLNKWPFINKSIQKIKVPNLSKSSDYGYDTKLSLEGENFTNISELKVKIEYNGNNDNAAEAEDVVLNTYEIEYITDIDGNVYKTVKIGDQWWMAENLKVTHYRNGDPIKYVTDRDEWYYLTTGAYCYYDNNDSLGQIYGGLYNWFAIDDERNIAPEGWHVPSEDEWDVLKRYLFENEIYWDQQGTALKSQNQWRRQNESIITGTDIYGFTAIPSGQRYENAEFKNLAKTYNFWLTTEVYKSDTHVRVPYITCTSNATYISNLIKEYGFSVRCVKD